MMKSILALTVLFQVGFLTGFAQKFKGEGRTHESEIIYSGDGTVVLETGEQLTGLIKHSRVTQRRVSISVDGKQTTYKIAEVKHFTIGDIYFEKIESPIVSIPQDYDFAILFSSPQSTIRVYEVCYQEDIAIGENAAKGLWPTNRSYHVLFPSAKKLKGLDDIAFIPFKKVTKLVSDCQPLVDKINNKEKGYFLSLVATSEQKLDAFINIANSYSQCK